MWRFKLSAIRLGCGLAVALLSLGLIVHRTTAAAGQGSILTTSPVAVDLAAKPGTQVSTKLQVQNNGTHAVTLNVKLDEFSAHGNSGQADIFVPPSNDPSVSWVHFSKTSFVAAPGVWNSVTMTVDLPKTAAYGYYYAVLFEPQAGLSSGTSSSKIKGANAIFVLLNAKVPGETNTLQVTSFSSDKSLYQFLPADFTVVTHNAGNIFTIPQGDIYISRTPSGPSMATLDINPGLGNILPGTNRQFHAMWRDGSPHYEHKLLDGQIISDKNGKPKEVLSWNGSLSKFRFGKYYARLVLVYNDGQQDVPVNAVVSFWVIPWTIIVVVLFIITLAAVGLWATLRGGGKAVRWVRRL